MPQGKKNSTKGPNSKEQRMTNESVINRNKSIKEEMDMMKVELLDIYEIMKPIQNLVQGKKDIHFSRKGEIIISDHICKRLKELFF